MDLTSPKFVFTTISDSSLANRRTNHQSSLHLLKYITNLWTNHHFKLFFKLIPATKPSIKIHSLSTTVTTLESSIAPSFTIKFWRGRVRENDTLNTCEEDEEVDWHYEEDEDRLLKSEDGYEGRRWWWTNDSMKDGFESLMNGELMMMKIEERDGAEWRFLEAVLSIRFSNEGDGVEGWTWN